MNKNQKQVAKASLEDEKRMMDELKKTFEDAKLDCDRRIRELSARDDMENLQSIIYQKKYQEAIRQQIEAALKDLSSGQYKTVNDYLTKCYQNGYVGAMFDLQGQGIPMAIPIDQKQLAQALTVDSKLSTKYYKADPLKMKVGEDVEQMKNNIRMELSRAIASGKTWNDAAKYIALDMNSPFRKAYNDALRIARTEGHRIQNQAALKACFDAKGKGADVVKQWDATMDGDTRPEHRKLDGQIRELDERFEVGKYKPRCAGDFGDPSQDCNCRCTTLQRARWALDEKELQKLKDKASFHGLDKADEFEAYRKKYLKL